jgi:predicted NACHT family NTPase
MLDDDYELRKKEHILGEDDAFLRWKKKLEKGRTTPEKYAKAVDRIYRKRMKAIGLDPDLDELALPLPSRRRWQENPEILLGYALNGIEVGLSLEEMCRGGIIVVGKPGSGKTTFLTHLAKQLINF